MRWFWIDKFTEFISGRRAVAIKNVSLSEEHLVDYMPGYPLLPASLIVEGLAFEDGAAVVPSLTVQRDLSNSLREIPKPLRKTKGSRV